MRYLDLKYVTIFYILKENWSYCSISFNNKTMLQVNHLIIQRNAFYLKLLNKIFVVPFENELTGFFVY